MAIKTDALQQSNAPALTDTLLLANSAGGTAQLSMAQAAAFFGAELVKTGNPVGTALSSKAALSAQQTVEAVSVPAQSVTLEASALQAYINDLPRLRTENLNIQVQAGHVPQTLKLENFYGPGFIWIVGRDTDTSFLDDGLVISNCSIGIRIIGFDVRGSSVGTGVRVSASKSVYPENLVIDGSNFQEAEPGGISADVGCIVSAGNCTISHCIRAIYTGGIVRLNNCNGSENASGIAVEGGGIVLLSGSTPNLLGGAANNRWGGMIVKKDGTLL